MIEHSHPYGDPGGDLLEDGGLGGVGRVRRDLESAVHRSGVTDRHVRPEHREPQSHVPDYTAVVTLERA